MREREWKLALPGRFEMPTLALDGTPVEMVPAAERLLRATYYDTHDLRLARHGATLRFRTGDATGDTWTVKLPARGSDGALMEREELSFGGSSREMPAEARSLVTAFARLEPLVAVATLRTRRRPATLLLDGVPIAELDDDEVSVTEGRRVVSRFRELEVEARGEDVDLAGIVEQLRAAGATDGEPIPKVVRALGSRATAPPDVDLVGAPRVGTMSDVVRVALAAGLARLVANDPLARLGDPEGIHQVRVALRRLRSDLRTLADATDDAWRMAVHRELRSVGGALANARDADVMIERLRADAADLAELGTLFGMLERRREEAAEEMRRALDEESYARLLDGLVDAVAELPRGPAADAPADEALRTSISAAWQRLARRVRRLPPSAEDAAYHEARIAAKEVRYAAELAALVLPARQKEAARLAGLAAEVQDLLGAVQDARVAEEVIRAWQADAESTAAAFAAGRLVERQAARGASHRARFHERWPAIRRRRWRAWLR